MHDPWEIEKNHPLTQALIQSVEAVSGKVPEDFDFGDFGTNAITPVAMGIPCISFEPGEYKLAHMVNERCAVTQIKEACEVYAGLIREL